MPPWRASTAANRLATAAGSVASQANARAPVSAHKSASLSVRRAATATARPFLTNSRASEDDSPGPVPTINALR